MNEQMNLIFPKPYNGIQVNYCVSTGCENFGKSDPELYQPVHNTNGLNIYYCPKCASYPQIIDNLAIHQTIEHQKQYHALSLVCCPDKTCSSHSCSVHVYPAHYRAFGKTNSLKQRYQCKTCQTVFTDQLSSVNPKSEQQTGIFYGVLYSLKIREICKKLNITAKGFYKLQHDMVDRLKYIAHVKDELFYQKTGDSHLSTGYQFLGEKQGAMIVATADTKSGYILGFDTNLVSDIPDNCLLDSKPKTPFHVPMTNNDRDALLSVITDQYETIMSRKNYLDPTSDGRPISHSYNGLLAQPYLITFAHALVLRDKLHNKTNRYYFVQQDTMLRNAFINASLKDLLYSKDHLFYFKEGTQEKGWFDGQKLNIRQVGWWKDRWGFHSEGATTKAACHIKGQGLSTDKWQSLLQQTSFDGVENYLNAVTDFFQGLSTSLNEQSINDWLHVFTGYYNFCLPNKNGKTPAQLLGLFDKPVTLGELLNGYELPRANAKP